MGDNAFHLKWNNHLQNMYSQLDALYNHQLLVDVSISCTDGILKAHRVVLSACSPYFETIFRDNHCKHPVLILKGVSSREMQALLNFMYRGSVEVLDVDLQSFMCTANELKIRGLADELLKDTIKLAIEKEDSSDDEQGKDGVDSEPVRQGEGSNIDGVKITDVRTADIPYDMHNEQEQSDEKESKKLGDTPFSDTKNNNNASKREESLSEVDPTASNNKVSLWILQCQRCHVLLCRFRTKSLVAFYS